MQIKISPVNGFLFVATLFVAILIFMSQTVSPLFSGITYQNNRAETVEFLQRLMHQPNFTDQFAVFAETYGNQALTDKVFSQSIKEKKDIGYYTELLKKNPASRDVLVKLSLLYKATGNVQKSNEYYQKARAIDPEVDSLIVTGSMY